MKIASAALFAVGLMAAASPLASGAPLKDMVEHELEYELDFECPVETLTTEMNIFIVGAVKDAYNEVYDPTEYVAKDVVFESATPETELQKKSLGQFVYWWSWRFRAEASTCRLCDPDNSDRLRLRGTHTAWADMVCAKINAGPFEELHGSSNCDIGYKGEVVSREAKDAPLKDMVEHELEYELDFECPVETLTTEMNTFIVGAVKDAYNEVYDPTEYVAKDVVFESATPETELQKKSLGQFVYWWSWRFRAEASTCRLCDPDNSDRLRLRGTHTAWADMVCAKINAGPFEELHGSSNCDIGYKGEVVSREAKDAPLKDMVEHELEYELDFECPVETLTTEMNIFIVGAVKDAYNEVYDPSEYVAKDVVFESATPETELQKKSLGQFVYWWSWRFRAEASTCRLCDPDNSDRLRLRGTHTAWADMVCAKINAGPFEELHGSSNCDIGYKGEVVSREVKDAPLKDMVEHELEYELDFECPVETLTTEMNTFIVGAVKDAYNEVYDPTEYVAKDVVFESATPETELQKKSLGQFVYWWSWRFRAEASTCRLCDPDNSDRLRLRGTHTAWADMVCAKINAGPFEELHGSSNCDIGYKGEVGTSLKNE